MCIFSHLCCLLFTCLCLQSRWFIYWIMVSLFASVTYLTDWVFWWLVSVPIHRITSIVVVVVVVIYLISYRIPFYDILKLCISIWLLPFFRVSCISMATLFPSGM